MPGREPSQLAVNKQRALLRAVPRAQHQTAGPGAAVIR